MLDCFLQIQSAFNMLRITLLMSGACAAVVFVLLAFFSKKAIAPFAQNLEKQRQFVTDASHELKTPLAILSADVGLLEDSCGQSRWLESARAQISRMDTLIQNLMELVRTEETVEDTSIGSFCVSDVAQACADAFEPLARESGKTLSARIDRGVCMRGVQDNLFRLFSILLDNAVKYCDAGGEISFSLYQKGRRDEIYSCSRRWNGGMAAGGTGRKDNSGGGLHPCDGPARRRCGNRDGLHGAGGHGAGE